MSKYNETCWYWIISDNPSLGKIGSGCAQSLEQCVNDCLNQINRGYNPRTAVITTYGSESMPLKEALRIVKLKEL
jgi:hypothetical protein